MVEKIEIPKILCSYKYSNQAKEVPLKDRLQHEENHSIRHQQIYIAKANEAS